MRRPLALCWTEELGVVAVPPDFEAEEVDPSGGSRQEQSCPTASSEQELNLELEPTF